MEMGHGQGINRFYLEVIFMIGVSAAVVGFVGAHLKWVSTDILT